MLFASTSMPAGPTSINSLQGGLARVLPKIDERKKAAYLKASNEAAKAAAALEEARKDSSSKSSMKKKTAGTSIKDAEEALAKAQAAAQEEVKGLLGEVDPFLANDQYDAQLVKGAILADTAKGGKGSLMNQLLGDTALMKQMLVAGGASHGRYGDAMEIYADIRRASPRAADGMFQRLALATALELAEPLPLRN